MLTANTNRPNLVREKGLEPLILAAGDFKSPVYTIPPLSLIFGGLGWSRTNIVYPVGRDLQSRDAHAIASTNPVILKSNYTKI